MNIAFELCFEDHAAFREKVKKGEDILSRRNDMIRGGNTCVMCGNSELAEWKVSLRGGTRKGWK